MERTIAGNRGRLVSHIMSTPLLELQGVSRVFQAGEGTFAALKDVNLSIMAGEMVAIVGASGSGKSTLMNILGCLDRPSYGIYRVGGRNTSQLSADELAGLRRERFGFVFQRYNLLPDLTAAENVQVPAAYAGCERSVRTERSLSLLRRLQIQDRASHRPAQLSGGQQQRVSIARALMNGGEIILADEPTGALDSHAGSEVLQVLRELNAEGHTVILVTHDASIARNARRILEISDGRILSDICVGHQSDPVVDPSRWDEKASRGPAPLTLLGEASRMALTAMRNRMLRTLLTMLGIVIGIAAVASVVALGKGGQEKVLADIRAIGTNTIEVFPGAAPGQMSASDASSLSVADAKAISGQIYIDSATPTLVVNTSLRTGNRVIQGPANGVGEEFFRVRDMPVVAGRTFSLAERVALAQVVVLDESVSDSLLPPGMNPIGQVILVGKTPFRVIGVVQTKRAFSQIQSFAVWIPYTSVMGRVVGHQRLDRISVRVSDDASMSQAAELIEAILRKRHDGRIDFHLLNSDAIRRTVESTTETMTLLVAAIAFISLIVGGVGVMNIMLVSVTERTREIGIRTAIGARYGDILQQFLIEATLICLAGGLLGILVAVGFRLLFDRLFPQFPMIFSASSIVMAVSVSTVMGVICGIVPARRAARLDPVEALASE
jgi:macrolide transport system ATP-binding/permease protein